MVGKKSKNKQLMTSENEKAANHNKIFSFSFKLEKNNLLNYQFKFMDCETVM